MAPLEKEMIQDVIDRLLYLDQKDYREYIEFIHRINALYPIKYEVIDNIRVYPVDKTSLI